MVCSRISRPPSLPYGPHRSLLLHLALPLRLPRLSWTRHDQSSSSAWSLLTWFPHGVRYASRKAHYGHGLNFDKFWAKGSFPLALVWPLGVKKQLNELGFTLQEADALRMCVWRRFRTYCLPAHTANVLSHYRHIDHATDEFANLVGKDLKIEKWVKKSIIQSTNKPEDLKTIGDHSLQTLANAVTALGLGYLEMAFTARKDHRDYERLILLGCYELEVAVLLGARDAAAALLNIAASEPGQTLLADSGNEVNFNTDAAKRLIKDTVEKSASCDWPVLAAYLSTEFNGNMLKRLPSSKLLWAMDKLNDPAQLTNHSTAAPEPTGRFWLARHLPQHHLLRLIDHCLDRTAPLYRDPSSASAPKQLVSSKSLNNWREECLQALATCNDPEASFILAVRDETFGSDKWVRMMTHATSIMIADAGWLLACYRWRRANLIPLPVVDSASEKGQTSLRQLSVLETLICTWKNWFTSAQTPTIESINFAIIGLYVTEDAVQVGCDPRARPRLAMERALGTAALLKFYGDDDKGRSLLRHMVDSVAKHPAFDKRTVQLAKQHLEEYSSPDLRIRWDEERCRTLVKAIVDPEALIHQLQRTKVFRLPP